MAPQKGENQLLAEQAARRFTLYCILFGVALLGFTHIVLTEGTGEVPGWIAFSGAVSMLARASEVARGEFFWTPTDKVLLLIWGTATLWAAVELLLMALA